DRLPAGVVESAARDGAYVAVQQARVQQGADEELHAARRVEVVDVGTAVGIDAGQQRDDGGEVGEVVPRQLDPRGRRDGDEMQRVVGRTARREQRDQAVDDRTLVDDLAERRVLLAAGDLDDAPARLLGQGLA